MTEAATLTDPTWDVIDAVISVAPAVLLYGPPGTGKTYVATKSGNRSPEDVFSVTLTEETPAAELRGHFVPHENGSFQWHDGPAVAAWRTGARLVVNEIIRGSGDALTLLFAIADDPEFARLTLPTGETVRPAPGFQIVATMNGDPEELPEALADRFPVTIEVASLAPGAVKALPEDLRSAARRSLDVPHEERVSTRRWKAFGSLRDQIGEEVAAHAVFGHRFRDVLNALKVSAGIPAKSAPSPLARHAVSDSSAVIADDAALPYTCWSCTEVKLHDPPPFRDPRDGDPMCENCYQGLCNDLTSSGESFDCQCLGCRKERGES